MDAALATYLAAVFAGVEVLSLRPLGGPNADGRESEGLRLRGALRG
jgi:hypothetical protein